MHEYSRNLADLDKEVSINLAQAGAVTPGIDLEQVIGGNIEGIVGQIQVPAVAGIADAKVLTFTLQDSADGVSFAPVDPAVVTTVAGISATGSPAKDARFRFPAGTRRYVRVAQTATSASGTFSGVEVFRLLF